MKDFWTNSEFALWHIRNEQRTYLPCVSLESFKTAGDAPLKECPYCAYVNKRGLGSCRQCGAPMTLTGNGARLGMMELAAIMPMNCDLLTSLRSGDVIELHHSSCGPWDYYEQGDRVLSLRIGTINGPRFGGLAPLDWPDHDRAELRLTVTGTVDINYPGTADC